MRGDSSETHSDFDRALTTVTSKQAPTTVQEESAPKQLGGEHIINLNLPANETNFKEGPVKTGK